MISKTVKVPLKRKDVFIIPGPTTPQSYGTPYPHPMTAYLTGGNYANTVIAYTMFAPLKKVDDKDGVIQLTPVGTHFGSCKAYLENALVDDQANPPAIQVFKGRYYIAMLTDLNTQYLEKVLREIEQAIEIPVEKRTKVRKIRNAHGVVLDAPDYWSQTTALASLYTWVARTQVTTMGMASENQVKKLLDFVTIQDVSYNSYAVKMWLTKLHLLIANKGKVDIEGMKSMVAQYGKHNAGAVAMPEQFWKPKT